jgi:isopentenyl diphosphate isomerase/L-lactate dehydrogenase-like FMN-dependent dehydrogenase
MAMLYSLAADGKAGVGAVLKRFADEVARTMTLVGASGIAMSVHLWISLGVPPPSRG